MIRKTKAHGTVAKAHASSGGGRPASEVHREFVAAIREGRLTRRQFDAWHAQRRENAGRPLVITLREVHAHSRRRHH